MDTTKTPSLVVSHDSALRAIRTARRQYARLPWRPLGAAEQRRVLASCAPNMGAIETSMLYRKGILEATKENDSLDALVASENMRRTIPLINNHIVRGELPTGSILEMEHGLYCTSPALTVAHYALSHSFPEIVALAQELCGTFSLHEHHMLTRDTRKDWSARSIEPAASLATPAHVQASHTMLEAQAVGAAQRRHLEADREQYYEAEPAVPAKELKRLLDKMAGLHGVRPAQRAARFALDNARSPGEAIMVSMFHLPHKFGGFNVRDLLLNHRIDFTPDARAIADMPYAILDAYISLARIALEYNGFYHDDPAARLHDERRDVGLEAMGITTIAINRKQLRDIEALESIARLIYKRAGIRYQNRTQGNRIKQVELLNGLRGAYGWQLC